MKLLTPTPTTQGRSLGMALYFPPLALPKAPRSRPGWRVPDESECVAAWDAYGMFENIREHSRKVARVAAHLAELGKRKGLDVDVDAVRASALLHDIAKSYCIKHGGNHSQLGAAWVMDLTGNPALAMGVQHHVYWPFEVDVEKYFLPMTVIYGDKRVMHDRIVPLGVRFTDLAERYGKTSAIRGRINRTLEQARQIEEGFSRLLGEDVHACTFDSGRLVERA